MNKVFELSFISSNITSKTSFLKFAYLEYLFVKSKISLIVKDDEKGLEKTLKALYKKDFIETSDNDDIEQDEIKRLLTVKDFKKFKALNEKLLKIRDKYGVDIIRYGSELNVRS